PPEPPGSLNQVLMGLGATVWTPSAPACIRCPLERLCLARAAGEERTLPISSRPRSPRAVSVVFALVTDNRRVLVVRRPRGQLLGGLWALPGGRSEEHTSELQSRVDLVCRLLLVKKKYSFKVISL